MPPTTDNLPVASAQRPGPADLLRSATNANLYKEAARRRLTVSALLELEDPSHRYKDTEDQGLDAFERLLKVAQIRVAGEFCDLWEKFHDHEQARALVPEYINRVCRRVSEASPQNNRAVFTSQDEILGSGLRPYEVAPGFRQNQLAPAIPLDTVIAMTTNITGVDFKAVYMPDIAVANIRMKRVAEGAEIPRVKLVTAERSVSLYKYGVGLEYTYEQVRRQRIDKIGFWMQRLQIQTEVDKLAMVLDVMINGDGNANTAATSYNLTTLDTGTTANNLTPLAWLSFKAKFANPYQLTTVLTQEAGYLKLALLSLGNANIPFVNLPSSLGFGDLRPINNQFGDGVAYGITSDAPAAKLVGFDGRLAIERIVETGGDIEEVERYINRQAQALFRTEVEGYMVFDASAVKILNLAS